MSTRLLSPAGDCDGVTVQDGTRYGGTIINVSNRRHINSLLQAGYTTGDVAGAPVRAGGFVCGCGFRSFFRLCGRCGRECERPDIVA